MMQVTLVALLLIGTTALARPSITAVTPDSGPVAGGTKVTISGSGFAEVCTSLGCSPPHVSFGRVAAAAVSLVNSTTIEAVTPAHLPKRTDVSVCQSDGCRALPDAFTFTGIPSDGFDMILLPVYTPLVRGAHGSEFRTDFRGWNSGASAIPIYGLEISWTILPPPFDPFEDPVTIGSGRGLTADLVSNGTPGRLLYVPKGLINGLSLNLRTYDTSRSATNFGTEIPVVREREFSNERIVLLGVPTDSRFRNTLRIYGLSALSVRVAINDGPPVDLTLRAGTDIFDPAYAMFTDFPTDVGPVRVTIDAVRTLILPAESAPIWAFISVTNNETQMITTITPQP